MFYLFHKNEEKQEQLKKALGDKDFLIKDVHHRTKNNLAMVKSFLNLQSDKIENLSEGLFGPVRYGNYPCFIPLWFANLISVFPF